MTAHELARALLEMPDVPVMLYKSEDVETGIGMMSCGEWVEVNSCLNAKASILLDCE